MAEFKITDLTELAAVDVDVSDLLEIVDLSADVSKKVSIASLKTALVTTQAVTDAGALMDSELASIADVKALNQSVVSGAAPVFDASNMTNIPSVPSGSDTQVQYNSSGSFAGSDGFTYVDGVVLTSQNINHKPLTVSLANGQIEDGFKLKSFAGVDLVKLTKDGKVVAVGGVDVSGSLVNLSSRANLSDNSTGETAFVSNTNGSNANKVNLTFSFTSISNALGVKKGLVINSGFTPSSGSNTYTLAELNPTINQTGGASGITRGIYINPTLTAAADFRALETANGKVKLTDTYSAGSGSLAGSLLELNQTWNTTGTVTAIKANITNTASNASSKIIDLQVGGATQFNVKANGVINSPNMPTSSAGLSSGDLWSDSGTIKIV